MENGKPDKKCKNSIKCQKKWKKNLYCVNIFPTILFYFSIFSTFPPLLQTIYFFHPQFSHIF